jgi:hypothetical protein
MPRRRKSRCHDNRIHVFQLDGASWRPAILPCIAEHTESYPDTATDSVLFGDNYFLR